MSEEDAAFYEEPFAFIEKHVKPYRQRLNVNGDSAVRAKNEREIWWRHARPRPKMRRAMAGLRRYIATPMVSSYRTFDFLPSILLPDQKLVVFSRDDDAFLGILHPVFIICGRLQLAPGLEPVMTLLTRIQPSLKHFLFQRG
jgi:hypothetical protein